MPLGLFHVLSSFDQLCTEKKKRNKLGFAQLSLFCQQHKY